MATAGLMVRSMSACTSALSLVKRLLFLSMASGSLLFSLFVSPLPTQASVLSDLAAKPSSPSAPTTSVPNGDNGRTIKVPFGSVVNVNLSMPNYVWSVPKSSNSAVLSATAASTSSIAGTATASFSAASRGTATVSAIAAPSCALSQPACRSEEHTSELQSQSNLVCRLLLEKKKSHRDLSVRKGTPRTVWPAVSRPSHRL